MNATTEHYNDGLYRVVSGQDTDCENPSDFMEDEAFVVAFHRNFHVTRDGISSFRDVESVADQYHLFPLSAYIHSGVRIYLGTHMVCEWDSGGVGYVMAKKSEISAEEAEQKAKWIVEAWNTYLSGDVWWVRLERIAPGEWEEVESLYGIYGRESLEHEAMCMENYAKQLRQSGGEQCQRGM